MLSGGDPRSLHGVPVVIGVAAGDAAAFEALFTCLFSGDEIVRMRAADALEKVARIAPERFVAYRRRLLRDVAQIDQASVQWHLAQILSEIELTAAQRGRAVAVLKRNLKRYDDWLVINLTLEGLARFAHDDPPLRAELIPVLQAHQASGRKSIATRATKLLSELRALRG